MSDKPTIVRTGILCPNHQAPLEGITSKDLLEGRGSAPCAISGEYFEWQADISTQFVDKFGRKFMRAKVTGHENG